MDTPGRMAAEAGSIQTRGTGGSVVLLMAGPVPPLPAGLPVPGAVDGLPLLLPPLPLGRGVVEVFPVPCPPLEDLPAPAELPVVAGPPLHPARTKAATSISTAQRTS